MLGLWSSMTVVQFGNNAGQETYKAFGDVDKQFKAVKGERLPTLGFGFRLGNVTG